MSLNQVDIIMVTYINPMIIKNQKPTINTKKTRKKGTQQYYKGRSSNHNRRNKMNKLREKNYKKTGKKVIKWQ